VLNLQPTIADPQRWNRYAYVRNGPLTYVDPDGKDPLPTPLRQFFDAFFQGDYSRADIQTGRVARAVAGAAGAAGVTVGRIVLLSQSGAEEYEQRTLEGISLVGHELAHTDQYRALGIRPFLTVYLAEYLANRIDGQEDYDAYLNITAEVLANLAQEAVMSFLERNPGVLKKLQQGKELDEKDLGRIAKWNLPQQHGDRLEPVVEGAARTNESRRAEEEYVRRISRR
jgi:hypothetical protein